jgi:archaellum biogenesis ATPase FlaH
MMTLAKGLLQKNHRVHIVSTHEANVDDALKQNLTYTVSEKLIDFFRRMIDYAKQDEKITV